MVTGTCLLISFLAGFAHPSGMAAGAQRTGLRAFAVA
jgi:hypothetical protein